MTIAKVAELLDLTKKAIRYYEGVGLIEPKISGNGYRDYSDEETRKLVIIKTLRNLYFSIDEIKQCLENDSKLITCFTSKSNQLQEDNQQLSSVIGLLNKFISKKGSLEDLPEFQKEVEKIAFEAGGKTQKAPAQRITDFVKGKISQSLPDSSYIPGTISSPLHEILPKVISERLRKSLSVFEKKMKGYFTEEAQILAAETRTSSPIRIPRDDETLMHIEINGLFPCGEGAGYAGGIVSAAIDGERCAEAITNYLLVTAPRQN